MALSSEDKLLVTKTVASRNVHSSMLTVFIREVMEEAGVKMAELDAVAVSKGPGSFTGLRIGVSVAKGIAWGLELPLISVSSLEALAGKASNNAGQDDILCPLIDARNNEFYFAVFSSKLRELLPADAGLISQEIFSPLEGYNKILFFGDGIEKIEDSILKIKKAEILKGIGADAASLSVLAYLKYVAGEFENIKTFEPFYLRDFKARNLGKKIGRILYPENEK